MENKYIGLAFPEVFKQQVTAISQNKKHVIDNRAVVSNFKHIKPSNTEPPPCQVKQ